MAIPFNIKLGTHRLATLEDFRIGLVYEVVEDASRKPAYGIPHTVKTETFLNDAREFAHFVNHSHAYINLESGQSEEHLAIVNEIKESKIYHDITSKEAVMADTATAEKSEPPQKEPTKVKKQKST